MRKLIFIGILLVNTLSIFAQKEIEKGLSSINVESAIAQVGFLASDALQGRQAGTIGGKITREYIKATLQDIGIKPLAGEYFNHFEAYSKERQTNTRYSVHPDSINKYKQDRVYRKLSLCNVLGIIEGANTHEYVVIGAHYDHIGMDENLVNDQIYNGADDNAAGVSATLQVARAFIISGVKPKRNIIFAFWDGEELGLLGSEYFISTTKFSTQIKAYLNFDMIGRNKDEKNPLHVDYFYAEKYPIFQTWLKNDIVNYKLNIAPVYRPSDKSLGGSDNSSFAKRDIPIIWYHTDGHPDYHQPSDHADKINYNKVLNISKSAFLNMWKLANNKY